MKAIKNVTVVSECFSITQYEQDVGKRTPYSHPNPVSLIKSNPVFVEHYGPPKAKCLGPNIEVRDARASRGPGGASPTPTAQVPG